MRPALRCPRCGQPLPSDAPQGLCPACLMRLACSGASQHDSDDPKHTLDPNNAHSPAVASELRATPGQELDARAPSRVGEALAPPASRKAGASKRQGEGQAPSTP